MVKLTPEEYAVLLELFDLDNSKTLDDAEISEMIKKLQSTPTEKMDKRMVPILKKFDTNGDGKIDAQEMDALVDNILHV
jgi:Ca2+-binding EF-hand superfamily protein